MSLLGQMGPQFRKHIGLDREGVDVNVEHHRSRPRTSPIFPSLDSPSHARIYSATNSIWGVFEGGDHELRLDRIDQTCSLPVLPIAPVISCVDVDPILGFGGGSFFSFSKTEARLAVLSQGKRVSELSIHFMGCASRY